MHSQYLEHCKDVVEDVYAIALKNSTYRKEHDKERKLQSKQCLDKLEQRDKALVRNVTPRSGPGKTRSYWEPEIAEVVSQYKNNVVYEIKSKSYLNKTKFFHRNMLMLVNHLLDTTDTVPTISPMKNKISPEMKNKISPKRKTELHKSRRGSKRNDKFN